MTKTKLRCPKCKQHVSNCDCSDGDLREWGFEPERIKEVAGYIVRRLELRVEWLWKMRQMSR